MDEYISREAVLKAFRITAKNSNKDYQRGLQDAIDCLVPEVIADIPSADVQPVERGKWEQDEKGAFHHCSECESKTFRDVDGWGYEYQEYLTDYCFRCGARMDAEPDEPWQSE